MNKKTIYIIIIVAALTWLASACAGASATQPPSSKPEPSATPFLPTSTAISPTETTAPSATPPPVDPGLLAYLEEMIAYVGEPNSYLIDLIIERVLKNPAAVVASIGPKLGDSNQSEASLAVYAWVLGVTQDPAAIDPLVELAKDTTSTWVKRNCIRSIGSIGGEQAGQGLLSLLEQITDKDQRYEILNILAGMQYEPALPTMGEILAADPNQEFWKPIFIFGKMGDLGVPYLLNKINDDDFNVRANSIFLLGRLLIVPEAAQPLREHYWLEEDKDIRGLILSSLEMITSDLETIQSFSEEVINKEKDADLIEFAQETIDSLPEMRNLIDSFISEKHVSSSDFQSEYNYLFGNYGHGDKKALTNTSTTEDEALLKNLREKILQRDSDEALYDYYEVNEIIRLNRLAQAVAEQEGKPWEAWPTATPEPTPPPTLESDSLPPPSQSVFVSAEDLVFSPKGNYIAASGFSSYFPGITILDAYTLNQTNTLDQFDTTDLDQLGDSELIDNLAFNPDETQLAITTFKTELDSQLWSESLWIWDFDSPQAELIASEDLVPNQGNFLGFSPGGSFLLWGINDTLRFFDGLTGVPLEDQPDLPALEIRSVAFSPDGNLLGICCSESAIILWDMQKNQVRGEIPEAPLIQTLIFTPEGNQLVAFDPRTQQIHYWDSKTQKPIMPSVKLAGHPNIYNSRSRISPDSRFLASIYSIREGFPANLLAVFNAQTGEPLGSLKCHTG